MRYKLIGCKVFMRELYHICAHSENIVEIIWMKEALHRSPPQLREALQQTIDRVEAELDQDDARCDGLLLAYGLCSRGTEGLFSRKLPLVIPKAHDCITMLLGSRKAYMDAFAAHSGGVYWYSPGWIEQFREAGFSADLDAKLVEYTEKYGEENAQYLIETERSWMEHYDCAAYIDWPQLKTDHLQAVTRERARQMELPYQRMEGSESLLARLVDGPWDDDFIVLKPGEHIAATNDDQVLGIRAGM